jgi:hypothetical protein
MGRHHRDARGGEVSRATAEDGIEHAFERAMRASMRDDARQAKRTAEDRAHAARLAEFFTLAVCDDCGERLEDATIPTCAKCTPERAAVELAFVADPGPRMHAHAEERVRTRIGLVLQAAQILSARPDASSIANALAYPEAVVAAGRGAALKAIGARVGSRYPEALRGPLSARVWDEYLCALEEHAKCQRDLARRYMDNGRARLAYAAHATQLETWAERLRAL